VATQVACVRLPTNPDDVGVEIVGMGELKALRASLAEVPRVSTMVSRLFNSAMPATAPFWTILKILAVIQALAKCATAVKSAVEQLSADPIIECLEKLIKALADVLKLFPPLVYVKMIVDIIILLRLIVDDMVDTLDAINTEIIAIQQALNSSEELLVELGECSKENMKQESANIILLCKIIGTVVQQILEMMDFIKDYLPGSEDAEDTPKGKFAAAKKKLEEAMDAISNFDASSDFPPLAVLLSILQLLRDILVYIEAAGKAVLGLDLSSIPSAPTWPTLGSS